jgi:hypothetical protein
MSHQIAVILVGLGTLVISLAGRQASAEERPLDEARLQAAGIRKLEGRHITLYTDLPSDPEIDGLPSAFDAAVPQWAAYFGVTPQQVADWHIKAYLIGDREPFDALGLMPAGGDQFVHGIVFGSALWLYEQPTAYYRRHLLLHEGTHAFMANFLGGCGPGWYMEGTAELLGTHRIDDQQESQTGELTVGIMPRDREEVPMLGRVKLVQDAFAENRALPLASVMQLDNSRQMDNEGYAWCWAAAKWLDSHPRYRDRFRRLHRHVQEPDFNDLVRREFADDWSDLSTEWQAYVATLDHNYDFERMAIAFRQGSPLSGSPTSVTIAADRGWQSSGVWLEQGREYLVTAKGRYEIARDDSAGRDEVWPSEPGGVTLEYYAGRPLGVLLGAIDARTTGSPGASTTKADQPAPRSHAADFAHPFAIGLRQTITPATSGTLYLRVNDSGGRLADNRGELSVKIEVMSSVDAAAR